MTTFWSEIAWVGGGAVAGVTIETDDGKISMVTFDSEPPPDALRLSGLTLPGMVNSHSHAFHRLLRGRTQVDAGSFWTWRDLMYAEAGRLDPDRYLVVARAVFAEMVQAGFTTVGEFHYLHHGPTGRPYDDPNAMGAAVIAAAADVGIRLTLLDACYLHGGIDEDGSYRPVDPIQARFSDGTADRWIERTSALRDAKRLRIGAAIHSVRAVDPESIGTISAGLGNRVLHVHVSEQPAENDRCLLAHGRTPTAVLADAGLVTERLTAVHATHLGRHDFDLLGRATVCLCPTTERDLADGIGPSVQLAQAGAALCIGTDSHAIIDPFVEIRGVEMHARLSSGRRANHRTAELLAMGSGSGYRSLGWPDGGRIEAGALADFVVVRLDSVRLAGTGLDQAAAVLFAATAEDVDTVIVGGDVVVSGGAHTSIDVAGEFARILG